MRDRLNQPAARQMLLYHYTDPPTAAAPDPLRATLHSELAALGEYPSLPRRIALANGSGTGVNQGFASGAQIVRYEFSNLLVDIVGNVWALPDGVTGNVFQGRIRILLSDATRTIPVSGTLPWDGAPGGSRATMAQMDSTTAPYGDIVALHPVHAFIPTVSALAIGTLDPFYDISGDPMLLEHTPFEAVFYPVVNEGHVTLSAAGAAWVANELRQGVLGVPETGPRDARLALGRPEPNPSTGITRFAFTLPRPGSARVSVVGIEGRRLATLIDSELPGGRHEVRWDGRDDRGMRVPPGVYFVVLETADGSTSRHIVRLH
jgi:hypothetical protein